MQSYNGVIRLFPNWDRKNDAAFHQLRAAGAFLVSASLENGTVRKIDILSEKGNNLKIRIPWEKGGYYTSNSGRKEIAGNLIDIKTTPGERIVLYP